MTVFNSEMHILTFLVVICEIIFFFFQVVYSILSPNETKRFYFLALLFLLIVYNVFGGLFPDPELSMSIINQNILAYGSGFLIACYIPFYFYKVFELDKIRFHALYGVWLFLFLPFVAFIGIEYSITGNLKVAVQHATPIPFLYALYILWILLTAIKQKYSLKGVVDKDVYLLYFAIIPWAALPVVSFFQMSQVVEVILTNFGFLIVTFLFCRQNTLESWEAERRLATLNGDITLLDPNADYFLNNCQYYNFTPREIEVASLLRSGLKYKDVAKDLFISEATIKKHVGNMFIKTEVNNRMQLIRRLEKKESYN